MRNQSTCGRPGPSRPLSVDVSSAVAHHTLPEGEQIWLPLPSGEGRGGVVKSRSCNAKAFIPFLLMGTLVF